MKEFIITVGIIFLFIGFFVGFFIVLNIIRKKTCLHSYSNYQPEYTFFSGCRIIYDGKLTPTDIVREIQ